jgi:hypothetical protein
MPNFAHHNALWRFREKAIETLRDCEFNDRVMVVGRDVGGTAFPETPYKCFLDQSLKGPESDELATAAFRLCLLHFYYTAEKTYR